MENYKEVPKQEFDSFIKSYPRKLSYHVVRICEPAMANYRDETLPTKGVVGDIDYYYDKVVAKIIFEWMDENGKNKDDGSLYKYMLRDFEVNKPEA
jgi:hypothetical protein